MLKNSVLQTLETTDKKFMADDVSIYGISNDSRFIDTSIPTGEVVVSSAMMNKFSLKVGDEVTLKENIPIRRIQLRLPAIINMTPLITVFMSRGDYLQMFNEDTDISRVISAMKN